MCAMAIPAAAAREADEVPLLIQDYSCANSFEEHVRTIEGVLTLLLDTEPLLRQFLVSPAAPAKSRRARLPLAAAERQQQQQQHVVTSSPVFNGYCSDESDDDDSGSDRTGSSSLSLLATSTYRSDAADAPQSRVFTFPMTLYTPSNANSGAAAAVSPSADGDADVVVEVHVRNTAHPITQQHGIPLFFLLRKAAVSASYREGETNYLLSMLATAVRQVMRRQKRQDVLRLGALSPYTDVSPLPSPFTFPDGCAPCFAPAGDSYKQTFVGLAPPLPTLSRVPLIPVSAGQAAAAAGRAGMAMSAAGASLLHHHNFTTRFLSDAFAHPPENCKTLSDFIDLFQLHVGQHSRIRSDEFEGICVSMAETYALSTPWKFYPRGPPVGKKKEAAKKQRTAAAEEASDMSNTTTGTTTPTTTPTPGADDGSGVALTWGEVLQKEIRHTRLLSGAFTHPFGTPTPPLKHVGFRFHWSQLQDVEAHEPRGRCSHLDPFHFSPTANTTVQAAAQQKCCIIAQAVPRSDEAVESGAAARLCGAVAQNYLDHPALLVKPRRRGRTKTANDGGGGDGEGEDASSARSRQGSGAVQTDDEDDEEPTRSTALSDLAARVVEWKGANTRLHASLIRRFDAPSGGAKDDEKTDDLAVSRRLRALRGTWEAHQQRFPIADNDGGGGGEVRSVNAELDATARNATARKLEERRGPAAAPTSRDLRDDYFPESLFSRFAFACATELPRAEDVVTLWRLCVDNMRGLVQRNTVVGVSEVGHAEGKSEEEEEEERERGWQRLLNALALPPADPPVDLSRPVLCQKFQLLRFALVSLLQPGSSSGGAGGASETATATPDAPSSSLRLITHGEAVVTPTPLPSPTTTSDVVLQRAMELNTHGSALVARASESWLQSDALYNDMCLFLYANKAHEGRVVRFPDFVHWHSPRDFVALAQSPATGRGHSDSDYLSDRMKEQPAENGGGGRGARHVWWALWDRAVPRSRVDILRTLFHPLEAVTSVLDWLAAQSTTSLLVEVHNACVANALHTLLCHRFLLGDASGGSGRGATAVPATGGGGSGSGSLPPPSPRLPALHAFVQTRCTSLTKDLEAASAIIATSRRGEINIAGDSFSAFAGAPSAVAAMELEMVRTSAASALRALGEIEVRLCMAIAVHYLLGFSADADAAATVRALCAPAPRTDSSSSSSTPIAAGGGGCPVMRTVTVRRATWASCFAKQFMHPESRVVQESVVRLTCIAERPLNTQGCFQQLVVHRDVTNTLRMALALTQEVL